MASPAVVQSVFTVLGGSGTTGALAFTANTTTGNAYATGHGGSGSAVTVSSIAVDTGAATFQQVSGARIANGTMNRFLDWWVATNITGGTTPTVTATYSGTNSQRLLSIQEVSNADTTDCRDSATTATGSNALMAATLTTTALWTMVLAAGDNTNSTTITGGTSYTLNHPAGLFAAAEYRPFADKNTKYASMTSGAAGTWIFSMIAVKSADPYPEAPWRTNVNILSPEDVYF